MNRSENQSINCDITKVKNTFDSIFLSIYFGCRRRTHWIRLGKTTKKKLLKIIATNQFEFDLFLLSHDWLQFAVNVIQTKKNVNRIIAIWISSNKKIEESRIKVSLMDVQYFFIIFCFSRVHKPTNFTLAIRFPINLVYTIKCLSSEFPIEIYSLKWNSISWSG